MNLDLSDIPKNWHETTTQMAIVFDKIEPLGFSRQETRWSDSGYSDGVGLTYRSQSSIGQEQFLTFFCEDMDRFYSQTTVSGFFSRPSLELGEYRALVDLLQDSHPVIRSSDELQRVRFFEFKTDHKLRALDIQEVLKPQFERALDQATTVLRPWLAWRR